jgi:hypothetical protein
LVLVIPSFGAENDEGDEEDDIISHSTLNEEGSKRRTNSVAEARVFDWIPKCSKGTDTTSFTILEEV